jgi:inner membrane protein
MTENIPSTPPVTPRSWTDHIVVKVAVIGFIILILMIPSVMIMGLVQERARRMQFVTNEVSSKWGQVQTLAGPYISIPYYEEVKKTDDKTEWVEKELHYFPKTLQVSGVLEPVLRKRSIFKVMLYESDLKLNGHFEYPNLAVLQISPDHVMWEKATIHLGISDLRGISQQVQIKAGDTLIAMTASSPMAIRFANGLSGHLPVSKLNSSGFDFEIALALKGSRGLYISPVANQTTVDLVSGWPSPKFEGQFLPDSSTISAKGFKAHWTILDINRQISQQWTDDIPQTLGAVSNDIGTSSDYYSGGVTSNETVLGVELLQTVDHYAKNDRTVKYAFLLIALTFIVYFFFEILKKQKVHPLQYGLVGAALVIFFILLLSLSEHIGFNAAYMTSSVATVVLITLYSRSIFSVKRFAFFVGGLLLLQFGFIYIILQLEDFALLAGSMALFCIIALIMYLTRRVKWS